MSKRHAWVAGCWRRLSTFLWRTFPGVTPTIVAQSIAARLALTPSYSRKRAKATAGSLGDVSRGTQSVQLNGGVLSLDSGTPSSVAKPPRENSSESNTVSAWMRTHRPAPGTTAHSFTCRPISVIASVESGEGGDIGGRRCGSEAFSPAANCEAFSACMSRRRPDVSLSESAHDGGNLRRRARQARAIVRWNLELVVHEHRHVEGVDRAVSGDLVVARRGAAKEIDARSVEPIAQPGERGVRHAGAVDRAADVDRAAERLGAGDVEALVEEAVAHQACVGVVAGSLVLNEPQRSDDLQQHAVVRPMDKVAAKGDGGGGDGGGGDGGGGDGGGGEGGGGEGGGGEGGGGLGG
eukprot:scaffold42654_cov66-Phaeocystis_antarctica.AAC.2